MKVTLDTNILVSGTFWNGSSFEILRRIDSGMVELVLSKELIEEYSKTINSNEIIEKALNKGLVMNKIIEEIILKSIIIKPFQKLEVVDDDPSDNKVLECALTGNVDYIITKDKHLLKLEEFEGIKIVNPEEFLKALKQD